MEIEIKKEVKIEIETVHIGGGSRTASEKPNIFFLFFLWVIFSGGFSETSQKMSESRTGQKTGWFVCEILGYF